MWFMLKLLIISISVGSIADYYIDLNNYLIVVGVTSMIFVEGMIVYSGCGDYLKVKYWEDLFFGWLEKW